MPYDQLIRTNGKACRKAVRAFVAALAGAGHDVVLAEERGPDFELDGETAGMLCVRWAAPRPSWDEEEWEEDEGQDCGGDMYLQRVMRHYGATLTALGKSPEAAEAMLRRARSRRGRRRRARRARSSD